MDTSSTIAPAAFNSSITFKTESFTSSWIPSPINSLGTATLRPVTSPVKKEVKSGVSTGAELESISS